MEGEKRKDRQDVSRKKSHLQLFLGDGLVSVDDEVLGTERAGHLELGRDVQARRAQELELGPHDRRRAQEPVH